MNFEILDEFSFERNISGFKAMDMFLSENSAKPYISYMKVNENDNKEKNIIFRNMNHLIPNIIYTFLDKDNKLIREKLRNVKKIDYYYYEFIEIFIQLCFAFERMTNYVLFPHDFSSITILTNISYSFDIEKTNYIIKSPIIPIITDFMNFSKDNKDKVKALKSLFIKAVSYYNSLHHDSITRVPLDKGGEILYKIFNEDLYNINDKITSPKEVLKILMKKHKIIKDIFQNIVYYKKKNEIENILTNPKIEYNRLTDSKNYKEVLDDCFPLKNDFLYLQYCIKIINTFPKCKDVDDKLFEINHYMIENDIKYKDDNQQIYKEIYKEIFEVEITKLTPKYIPELLKITKNPEIMKSIGKGKTWGEKELYEKVYRAYNWVILKQNRVVGYIGLHKFFGDVFQLRVFVDAYSSGQGIGSDAVKIVLNVMGTSEKIIGVVSAYNIPSQKMLEKAGMKYEKSEIIYGGLHYIYKFMS